jgi:hypothetical protein
LIQQAGKSVRGSVIEASTLIVFPINPQVTVENQPHAHKVPFLCFAVRGVRVTEL